MMKLVNAMRDLFVTCWMCKGTGLQPGMFTNRSCPICDGTGLVNKYDAAWGRVIPLLNDKENLNV